MFVLPKCALSWSSFYCSKQDMMPDPHLLFQRVSKTNRLRFEAVVNLLREGKKVVSTRVSGIGKSTEINAHLMEFLSHLGEEGLPREIWYRFNRSLLQYKLSKGVPSIKVLRHVSSEDLLDLTEKYAFTPVKDCPVAIMEMFETEINPCSRILILVQPSNYDIFETTKELRKGGVMLENLLTTADLINMALFKAKFWSEPLFYGKTKGEIAQLIEERVKPVGPITRFVLHRL